MELFTRKDDCVGEKKKENRMTKETKYKIGDNYRENEESYIEKGKIRKRNLILKTKIYRGKRKEE